MRTPVGAATLTGLRAVLADLYGETGPARRVTTEAGLYLGRINYSQPADELWHDILEEALKQGRLRPLVELALEEYPGNPDLAPAWQAYLAEPATPIQTLPLSSSPFVAPPPPDSFAGRAKEIADLTARLLKGNDVAISAAVAGMGGIGKTTLAQKLGRDLAARFPGGVLWVEVGYGADGAGVVDKLALQIGLDVRDQPDPGQRAALVQRGLAGRGRLLVVLDDLWDLELGRWLVRQVLPTERALLVTSRDVGLSRRLCGYVERLDVLPEDDALALLANILGPLDGHEAAAKAVIGLVEGLPLALELAAKLCDNGPADLGWVARQLQGKPSSGHPQAGRPGGAGDQRRGLPGPELPRAGSGPAATLPGVRGLCAGGVRSGGPGGGLGG